MTWYQFAQLVFSVAILAIILAIIAAGILAFAWFDWIAYHQRFPNCAFWTWFFP